MSEAMVGVPGHAPTEIFRKKLVQFGAFEGPVYSL